MEKNNSSEQPEIYALRQDGGAWQISRRDFLKAAGLGAAAISAGMGSGCSRSKPLDDICRESTTTQGAIKRLFTSQDGKYLLSLDIGKNLQQAEQNVLSCWDFAILSNQKQALICTRSKYRLVSLEDGTTVWEQDKPDPDNQLSAINSAAVAPDGETGIILCEVDSVYSICLISLADGSRIRSFELGKRQGGARNFAGPVVNNASTQVAVAVENNLFFFSLPDLRLIACPVDLDVLWYKNKGIEVTGKDPVTGAEYKYTTVCGASIPKGAVCTCNCVAGSSCACVGHKSSEGSSGSTHYWHPN